MTPKGGRVLRAIRDAAPWRHPVWFLVLGFGGFVIGVGLLWLGSDQTPESDRFVHTTGFTVWAAVIGAQTAYWALVAGPLWVELAALWRQTPDGRITSLLAAALPFLVITVLLFSVPAVSWPLWGQTVKTRALTVIAGVVVGVPSLFGMALVQRRVSRQVRTPVTPEAVQVAVAARAQLLRFLSVAGAVIGLAVLAAGALRKATVPQFVPDSELPQEGILLYGALFTGVLLVVYAPAHLALKRLGMHIRDQYFPLADMPAPDSDSFKGWLEKRSALEAALQLAVTPSQQLQASLFILAPLLSAVVTSLVPKPT